MNLSAKCLPIPIITTIATTPTTAQHLREVIHLRQTVVHRLQEVAAVVVAVAAEEDPAGLPDKGGL